MTEGFWPLGRAGAVSLTFDDGLDSQLALALPELDRRDLRATFYVNPSGSEDSPSQRFPWRERLERWRAAHDAGHEIADHTVLHPCSLNIDTETAWGSPTLRRWTLERIEADLREAERRLDEVFGPEPRTFAYPCYGTSVGQGATRRSYIPLVARTFSAGRVGGELAGSLANDPLHTDLHALSSFPVERQSGATMVGLAETATARGRWAVFTLHGIHEGSLSVSLEDLVEMLDFLVRRSDEIWVGTVAEVAAYVRDRAPAIDLA